MSNLSDMKALRDIKFIRHENFTRQVKFIRHENLLVVQFVTSFKKERSVRCILYIALVQPFQYISVVDIEFIYCY